MEVLNSGPVQAKSFQTKNGECENDYKVDSLKVNPKPAVCTIDGLESNNTDGPCV